MLFNSFTFLGLLLLTFIAYYLPRLRRHQALTLIVSSLVFYAYDNPMLVILLLCSGALNILVSYYVALEGVRRRKLIAIAGVALNLLLLAFFKYGKLAAKTIFDPDDSVGRWLLTIPLPIGISFFTFEGISLLVDVFKEPANQRSRLVPASLGRHARNTLFFISFFPHLVAGPILKAHDFYPQIGTKKIGDINWDNCFKTLIIGYFLKMVVADNLKDFTFWIAFPYFQSMSSINLVAMLFGYSFQIFADFAGYSLIAIGLARLFGYRFNDNFNFPYISTSFKEFWKRWHISLSSFLMEYLYFPLGGNRKGKARTYLNLMITMVLGGLWHGAAWSYAVWGAFHGVALATERFISNNVKIKTNAIAQVLLGIMVFFFITLSWLLFKLPEFSQVILYFKSIGDNSSLAVNMQSILYILVYSAPVIIYHAFYLFKEHSWFAVIKRSDYLLYAIMLFLILVNSGSSGSFIYFQF